jgi:hydroxymethylglutaryl-CoA synthase
VDQRRSTKDQFVRMWEERWIRDEGFFRLAGKAIKLALEKAGLKGDQIKKSIIAVANVRALMGFAPKVGLDPRSIDLGLLDKTGDTGASYPILLLVNALEKAKPGDHILLVSFQSGADAIILKVADGVENFKPEMGVSGYLKSKDKGMNYEKYALFKRIIPAETGIRGELEAPTALSTLWRESKSVFGFYGVKCTQCGTPQFPNHRICVNPDCKAIDQFEPYRFSDKPGTIFTFTGDYLAFSQDPPAVYGLIDYDNGGRVWMDFTDCELKKVKVGQKIKNSFRRKYVDELRQIHGYFWKAVPQMEEEGGK